MQKKFGALRFIGTIFKILGVLIGIIAILGAIFFIAAFSMSGTILNSVLGQYGYQAEIGGYGVVAGVIAGILSLIVGGVWSLSTYGLGELCFVLIAIEENTRGTLVLMQSGNKPQQGIG